MIKIYEKRILHMKTKNEIWKTIADIAYNLYYSSGIVYVPKYIFQEFRLLIVYKHQYHVLIKD
jgi:hypothetical protein